MNIKLGIDTGGSYTDAVLVDCDSGEIIDKAKAPTTKENLTIGISSAINQLDIEQVKNICLVCLSTTLATNAIVESKGAIVGLITIDEPEEYNYPVTYKYNVKGKINVKGCEISPLDTESAEQALKSMKGKIEALAISGYASVRNPVYEQKIREMSDEILGVPVVCAHELTNVLGYYERTITAALNANLIPIIKDLIASTKEVLSLKGIKAQLVIIKGNGNCMVDSFAEERPVETSLSGPAASALGGIALANRNSMVVADMGGTTLDIVPILNNRLPIDEEGAVVGHWRTRVKAMRTRSFGLGGDSYMCMDNTGNLSFGPERVVPLCVEAAQNSDLIDEIRRFSLCNNYHIVERQEADCLRLFKVANIEKDVWSSEEKEIIEILKEKSHSILYICNEMKKDIDSLRVKNLLAHEVIQLVSLTPTDVLHATGEYDAYNSEIVEIVMRRLAKRKNMEYADFIEHAENIFTDKICLALIKSLLIEKGVNEKHISDEVIKCIFYQDIQGAGLADFKLKLNVPIVGIGAPAKVWFPKVARKLKCEIIIPEHSEVANAVGTVSGGIRESLEALIRYDFHTKRYMAHLPDKRIIFDKLSEAVSFTEKELMIYSRTFAEKLGIKKYNVTICNDKNENVDFYHSDNEFVDVRMKVVISADTDSINKDRMCSSN